MSVRQYTAAERVALAGGLNKPEFERVCGELERAVHELCKGKPLAAIAAAIHGLTCGNPALRDALDTIDAVCAAHGGRPVVTVVVDSDGAGWQRAPMPAPRDDGPA